MPLDGYHGNEGGLGKVSGGGAQNPAGGGGS